MEIDEDLFKKPV